MPGCSPWKLAPKSLPIPPYLLGVLLGDGMMGQEALMFSTADQEIVSAVKDQIPQSCTVLEVGKYDYRIKKGPGKRHPLMSALRELELHGKKSHQKFVPQQYLLGSADQRLAVLQGLMDTDGSISKTGAMEFSSTSKQLAEDVVFLVVSLGGRSLAQPRQTYCKGKPGRPSWRVRVGLNLCPFRLKRKARKWGKRKNTTDRVLHRIEKSEPGPATCISVAHPDRTYVTAHGVVTHNTFGMGGYELTAHLTGRYPGWWAGRRFTRPIRAWAAGKTRETTRDIVQATLMGELVKTATGRKFFDGTGVIPADAFGNMSFRSGGSDLLDTIKIRHASGGWSSLGFKSYEQGRGAFEGTAQHAIWLDEEPPEDVYGECLIRTATTNGIIMLTFTPLEGLSEVVMQFLPQEMRLDEGE
jgi:phage terminase large subunit-like protein